MSEWTDIRDEVSRRLWRTPLLVAGATLLFFSVAAILSALVASLSRLEGPTQDGYLAAVWISQGQDVLIRWIPFAVVVLVVLRILLPQPEAVGVARVLRRSALSAVAGALAAVIVQAVLVASFPLPPQPIHLVSTGVQTFLAGVPVVVLFTVLTRLILPAKRG